ncbi:MAG: TonB-dependent receptor [Gammaproteobacteria bacterium]|nr:TonB-dependent receptor [Gammaproteobacteria bacterium]
MRTRFLRGICFIITTTLLFFPISNSALGAEDRQLEEVIVTAERREASISDTSISITAFTAEAIEEFGIRNQEDLQAMVPAAVIEPYDMAIRGVGRNFRSLGGDPGIATYQNGVYSEDFGIASTEGGLFDVERIEFLRGPQGTLYGRNAIGGAVNFINKKPTDEFYGELRTLVGNFNLLEVYGVVSGPIIKDVLSARFVGMNRERDGYYKDLSGNPDPGDYGDENYALSLRWTPTDSITFNIRGNERSYHRMMGGADAAGILNLSQRGGKDTERDTSTYAWGFRAVDPGIACPDKLTRTPYIATPGVINGTSCMITGQETFNFRNPVDGSNVVAQRVTPGADIATTGTTDHYNYAYGHDPARQRLIGISGVEGGDLKTDTSGQQDEFFDHQAMSFDLTWDVNDKFAMKYIFGYTDYFYDRESDVDLTSNPLGDRTFYVSQDTNYVSNELQFFFDPNENLSITAGAFVYHAKIRQRGDFYDYNCVGNADCQSRYANGEPLGILAGIPKVDLFTALDAGNAVDSGGDAPFNCLSGAAIAAQDQLDWYCYGAWEGDKGDSVPHGPSTIGTDLEYQTRTERDAYAAFAQGVYQINDHFALTLGLRWARDELDGYETLFYYAEQTIVPLGFEDTPFAGGGTGCIVDNCTSTLAAMNQALGYMDAEGNILNPSRLMLAGIPSSQSLSRRLDKNTEDVTWRANLDWTPTDETLFYVSATKGLRSGGFNLVFFSGQGTFDAEELIAYELGYKGTLLNNKLQLNSAVYFYDYENVHTFANGVAFAGGYTTNVVPVPEAELYGLDLELTWLATASLTLGFHGSYTGTEYTKDYFVIDPNDPEQPESLFDATTNLINIKGNSMIRVPEFKAGGWAMYNLALSSGGDIDFSMNYSWIDRVYFSVFEREDQSADSYDRLDLRVAWHPNESWVVAAFVNNVFDDIGFRQIEQYGATESGGWRRTGTPSDPRLYGLEVRFKMGAF